MASILDIKTRENEIKEKFQYLKKITGNKFFDEEKKRNRKKT